MKNLKCLTFALASLFYLTGCGQTAGEAEPSVNKETQAVQTEAISAASYAEENQKKILAETPDVEVAPQGSTTKQVPADMEVLDAEIKNNK